MSDPTDRPPVLPRVDLERLDARAAETWPHLTRTERAAALRLVDEMSDTLRRYEIALAAGQRGAL